jgi:hypothetical protein
MQKKAQRSEGYLDSSNKRSFIGKVFKKLWKHFVRSLPWSGHQSAAEQFIRANEDLYLKYLKAEYW